MPWLQIHAQTFYACTCYTLALCNIAVILDAEYTCIYAAPVVGLAVSLSFLYLP